MTRRLRGSPRRGRACHAARAAGAMDPVRHPVPRRRRRPTTVTLSVTNTWANGGGDEMTCVRITSPRRFTVTGATITAAGPVRPTRRGRSFGRLERGGFKNPADDFPLSARHLTATFTISTVSPCWSGEALTSGEPRAAGPAIPTPAVAVLGVRRHSPRRHRNADPEATRPTSTPSTPTPTAGAAGTGPLPSVPCRFWCPCPSVERAPTPTPRAEGSPEHFAGRCGRGTRRGPRGPGGGPLRT